MGTLCRKGSLVLARLCAGCLLITLCCLTVQASLERPGVRILGAGEMASIIGDAPVYCVKTITCKTGVIETNVCAYCDETPNRKICCVAGEGNICTYTGTASPCGTTEKTNRYTTSTYTPEASCNTCTGGGFATSGNCNALKNAAGNTNCP